MSKSGGAETPIGTPSAGQGAWGKSFVLLTARGY